MGQHHVARFHLRAWSEEGLIYRLNLKTRTVRRRGLGGVANEKLFYKLHDLTPEEHSLIEKAIIEPSPEPLKEVQRNFITMFCLPPRIKERFQVDSLSPDFTVPLNDMIANAAERYHSRIETCLKPYVASMLSGDASFYLNTEQAADFLYAISVQFTRTKRARQAALSAIGTKYKGCDPERMWSVLSHIIATNLGRSLFVERDQFRIVLLDNSSNDPFVTSDQPIINLHATFTGMAPEKLEFFYPLSPKKAMLLIETSNSAHADPSLSAVAVNSYNVLMMRNSYEQVFSNSADYLEMIRKIPLF